MKLKRPYFVNPIKDLIIKKMFNLTPSFHTDMKKDKTKEISTYVNYKEVIKSRTAARKGIDNTPNEEQLDNIRKLCKNVFDPLRVWVGGPIIVTSLFRSEALNREIGGSSVSQHMANNGAAIDIDDTYEHKTNAEMFNYIKDNLVFDQLIAEFPINGDPQWIHVSYNENDNKGNIFIAKKVDGKTTYVNYIGNENLVN